ncbi:hypothetical protein ORL44_28150, partial [Klebsiella oxytoca]|nr:hypothetical protein [Klebsiella oxytoca]
GSAEGGEPVARAGARRRPRGHSAEWRHFPEAMLRICPGYRIAAICRAVARVSRLRRDPGNDFTP